MNRGILTSLTAIGAAQLLKVPLKQRKTGKWEWKTLIETGGMPSSHSAAVASLATYTALKKGIKSTDFAICTIFGSIVIYDAMGIRRHAGYTAIEVNKLDQKVEELAGHHPEISHNKREEELKEMLGHQPVEVIGGTLLGIALGTISYLLGTKK